MRTVLCKVFIVVSIFYGSLHCMRQETVRWRRRTNYKKILNIIQSTKNSIKRTKARTAAICQALKNIKSESEEIKLKIKWCTSESEKYNFETEVLKLETKKQMEQLRRIIEITDAERENLDTESSRVYLEMLYTRLRNKDSLEKIEDLLKKGAHVNAPKYFEDCNDVFGLHMNTLHAALYHELPLEYILLLCRYKVDVNMLGFDSQETPCHSIIRDLAKPGMVEIIRVLMAYGADFSIGNHNGDTVFHQAASDRNLQACFLLTGQEDKAIKTFLLINKANKSNKKPYWMPKYIMKLVFDFAFPYSGVYTDNYIYNKKRPIKELLEKKNKKGKTAYDIVSVDKTINEKILPLLDSRNY